MVSGDAEQGSRRDDGGGDRHLLLAVDGAKESERAVLYVADFLGGFPGFRITLFHVITVPEEERLEAAGGRDSWLRNKESDVNELLHRYREILIQSGFPPSKVQTLTLESHKELVSEVILRKHVDIGACTIVIGRRKKSRKEEFLFGSVSSRIVRQAGQCSVWVIE